MAVTAQSQNTQTATLTTEHTLLDVSIAGVFQLYVDLTNMVDGDITELRVYQIILTSGTRHLHSYGRFEGAPLGEAVAFSVPVGNELTDSGSLRFTLKQLVGTGRTYPWKVLSYA